MPRRLGNSGIHYAGRRVRGVRGPLPSKEAFLIKQIHFAERKLIVSA
jgi:hypothetical protein